MSDPVALTPTPAAWTCSTCGGSYPADFAVCPRDATPRIERGGDPLVGSVLGGTYRITRVLGEGGMARLYEAQHLRIDLKVAVKVIHGDLSRYPELITRFEREARAAGRIRSPHVVTVVDVVRTGDDRPSIVTELLEGEDLQARLDRVGRMTPSEAIPIVRQICAALSAAHACGVIHRDLKPSNVFLCKGEDELVKVLDFGVAKMEGDRNLTETGAVVGTPAYMAPEQARRAADAGPLADVYTAGAVLFRMLTGEPPYGKEPSANPYLLLLAGEPSRPRSVEPSIPEAIEAVIQHAMAREPSARPASALALDIELAAFEKSPSAIVSRTVPILLDESTRAAAHRIAREAKRARPLAVALVLSASLAAAFYTRGLVAALFLGGAARTTSEQSLLLVMALAAGLGVAGFEARTLSSRWRSARAVFDHDRFLAGILGAGLATLGALDLAGLVATAKLVLCALAVALAIAWPRLFKAKKKS